MQCNAKILLSLFFIMSQTLWSSLTFSWCVWSHRANRCQMFGCSCFAWNLKGRDSLIMFFFFSFCNCHTSSIDAVMTCNERLKSSTDKEIYDVEVFLHSFFCRCVTRVYEMKLDQVSEAGTRRRNRGICHGEELNPVLIEATWILSCVEDESPQTALACFVPQSQQRLSLCHIEADVQNLDRQQVKQSTCDNAAVPGTGEAECRTANTESGY